VLHVQQMLGQRLAERFEPLTEAGRETMRLWYDGECRYIDDEVARLIDGIRTRHPNTIIAVTSDHGEEFWEHEGMGHGTTLYQEQLRVPLFILGPKVAPEVIDAPVSTVGIYKTVVGRLGLEDPGLQGEDLLGGAFDGLAFARTRGPSSDQQVDLDAAQQGALKALRDAGRLYEYDLDADPGERAPRPGSAESLRRLDEHREQNAARRVGGKAGSKPLSREDIEQLEALGYLQGE
jgi:arylsulfatase A-like enzyme